MSTPFLQSIKDLMDKLRKQQKEGLWSYLKGPYGQIVACSGLKALKLVSFYDSTWSARDVKNLKHSIPEFSLNQFATAFKFFLIAKTIYFVAFGRRRGQRRYTKIRDITCE